MFSFLINVSSKKKLKKACTLFMSFLRKELSFGEIDKKCNRLKHHFNGAISPSCGVLEYCFQSFPDMNQITYLMS